MFETGLKNHVLLYTCSMIHFLGAQLMLQRLRHESRKPTAFFVMLRRTVFLSSYPPNAFDGLDSISNRRPPPPYLPPPYEKDPRTELLRKALSNNDPKDLCPFHASVRKAGAHNDTREQGELRIGCNRKPSVCRLHGTASNVAHAAHG